jgi:hypothetical protein
MLHDQHVSEVRKVCEASLKLQSHELFHILFRYGSLTDLQQAWPWDTVEGKLQLITASASQPSTGTQPNNGNNVTLSTPSRTLITTNRVRSKPPMSLGTEL